MGKWTVEARVVIEVEADSYDEAVSEAQLDIDAGSSDLSWVACESVEEIG